MMLSVPVHGWTDPSLPGLGEGVRLSYLTDVPLDWLRTLRASLSANVPAALYGDTEGTEVYIVLYRDFAAAVLDDGGEPRTVRLGVTEEAVARMLMEDVGAALDAWAAWLPESEFQEDLSGRRAELDEAVRELGSVLAGT